MDSTEIIKSLHSWKEGGRGATMMSTFDYKTSHDKMYIEGFRDGASKIANDTYDKVIKVLASHGKTEVTEEIVSILKSTIESL